MEETKTYLELSEADGRSHKFYEVSAADKQVTICYGWIGDAGQTKVSSFATPEKAQADAMKKSNEKVRRLEVRQAARGDFYRASSTIKKLV